jgi:hypothetical protein
MKRKVIHRPDRDRAIFELLRAIKGRTAKEIAEKASYGKGCGNVTQATIYNWRKAKNATRYPRHLTMVAVARAVGLEYKLLRTNKEQ